MPRILSRQNAGKSFVNSLTLHEGGTGKNTPTDALDALYGIPSGLKGEPLGPVELDGAGRLNLSALEGISLTDTGIDGDSTIQLRETKEYFLTTYDSYQTYEVEGVLGTARIERNVIYYTAGEMPGIGGFIINGRRINVLVQGIAMLKPSITVPINNAVDRPLFMTFIGSSFQTLGGSDTHVSSDWELATDVNFVDVVQRSQDDSVNLTSWAVTDMQELKKHYVRVRYKGQNAGLSPWSNAVGFTTGNDGLINTETGVIYSTPTEHNSFFGGCVNISADGTMALVGAPYSNYSGYTRNGAVYYFKLENGVWTQKQKILAPFSQNTGLFGWFFAMDANADIAIITAYSVLTPQDGRGEAYYYKRINDSWVYQGKITRSDPSSVNSFGTSASLSSDGTHLLISAQSDSTQGVNSGAMYYFTRSGDVWTQRQKFYAPDPQAGAYFSNSCVISNDGLYAVIGAYDYSGAFTNQGKIYIYERSGNTWTKTGDFLSPTPKAGEKFGAGITLSPDKHTLYISEFKNEIDQTRKLSKYTRSGNAWSYSSDIILSKDETVLQPSNFANVPMFLIGARSSNLNGSEVGCVYVFQ